MISYEKTKLANRSIYEIAPGGLQENTDRSRLTIIVLLGDKILSEMDSETEVTEDIATATILGASGEEIDTRKGCKYQTGYERRKNYVVGGGMIDKGDLDENVVAEYKDVTATVVIIELAIGDVRAELGEAKVQISELSATVNALLVTDLEE